VVGHRDRGAQLADEGREVFIIEVTKPGQIAEVTRDAVTGRLGQSLLGDVQAIVPAAHGVQHFVVPGGQQHQAHPVGVTDPGNAAAGRIGHFPPLAVEIAGCAASPTAPA
jgi:hypothetical protein